MNIDKNTDGSGDFHYQGLKRFDFLMKRYLKKEASEPEKDELQKMTENGFEGRFRKWLDEYEEMDTEHVKMSGKARKEILTNILGTDRPLARRSGIWWSWAAAVILALGGVLWLSIRNDRLTGESISQKTPSTVESERQVLKGKQFFILPDGSSVLMNESSELSYSPASFQDGSREVTLKGEAYFDIVHNPKQPFLVKSGSVVTRVLGTSFNVNMQEKKVIVTVTRGLVEVGGEDHVYARIRPDEQITVNTETEQYKTASVSAVQEIAWKNEYLVFDNINLEKAAQLIQDQYGVTLVFTEAEVKKCRITASFLNAENLDTVLTVLSKMIGASYRVDQNKVSIEGGSCE